MAFTPEFLDELRARAPLAGVIGRRLRLIKRGREHVALCPFHNEKTPSFTVNEDKGFFHCFGCGAHGDVVGFVMQADNLSFPDAVEKMAAEVGLVVPERTPEDEEAKDKRAALYEVIEAACAWFKAQLEGEAGTAARDYLRHRGLSEGTIAEFRLGHAPSSRGALRQALAARRFSDEVMIEAGLLVVPSAGGEPYDRFRDRVIFPIADRRGRTVAFGGRALGEAKAKYLNSPETPLFHKGRLLYNLAAARAAIREAGTVVVAEGYMDVIALAQAGIRHAVAPLGTALNETQMQELWRVAPEPVLCFDGDEAGRRAAHRTAERALKLLEPGRSLRFALLGSGEDPDSLIARRGVEAMAELIAAAAPLSELLWRATVGNRKIDTPERRADLEHSLLALTRDIRDQTIRQYYRAHFKSRLWQAFRGPGPRGARLVASDRLSEPGPLVTGVGEPGRRREEVLLLTLINHPAVLEHSLEALAEIEFATPELDRLRHAIIEIVGREPDLDTGGLKVHLNERGFSDIVARVAGREVAVHGGFAKQGATLEDAEMGWRHALARHRRALLRTRLQVVAAELAADMTLQNEARFFAVCRELEESGGEEAEPAS